MSFSASNDAATAEETVRGYAAQASEAVPRERETAKPIGRPVLRIVPPQAPETPDEADWFEPQPASTASLPDPEPLVANLALCVIEAMAGVRDIEQLARWVSADVYRALLVRVQHSARARTARRQNARRPNVHVQLTTLQSPNDGVIEAVVVMDVGPRVRAIAMRLDGMDRRWRATSLTVL